MHQRSFQRSSNQRCELVAGVVVEHVDVQLALLREAATGQVAAAEVADDRVDRVGPEEQVELGVQRVAEEQLDDDLPGAESGRPGGASPASSALVGTPKVSCSRNSSASSLLEAERGLVVDPVLEPRRLMALAELVLRAAAACRRAAGSSGRRRRTSARRSGRSASSRAG